MPSAVSVPNSFTNATTADAPAVNANFAALVSWINLWVMPLDSTKAFTAVPSGPAGTDPSSADQLSRKAYVDAQVTAAIASANATSAAALASATTRMGCEFTVSGASLPNITDQTITFNAGSSVGSSWATLASATVSPPSSGVFVMTARVTNAAGAGVGINGLSVSITVAGACVATSAQSSSSTYAGVASVSATRYITAGVPIQVKVYQQGGSTSSGNVEITVWRVSI